jgi:ankyrin repeat protein
VLLVIEPNQTELVKLLVEPLFNNHYTDKDGKSALHVLAARGVLQEWLPLWQADEAAINAADNNGETPLHVSAANKREESTASLLAHNANVNARDKYGRTPLHCNALAGDLRTMELLLTHVATINAQDTSGATPLHFTASIVIRSGNREIVKLLVSAGANTKITNNDGYTAPKVLR